MREFLLPDASSCRIDNGVTVRREPLPTPSQLGHGSFSGRICDNRFYIPLVAAVSKEEAEDQNHHHHHHHHHHGKLPYNGYSDEFLDRLEPNGNIPEGKGDIRYGESLKQGNELLDEHLPL